MTTLDDAIKLLHKKLERDRRGSTVEYAEIARASAFFATMVPEWYWRLIRDIPLCGSNLAYSRSGGQLDIGWLYPNEMIEEAKDAYPGMVAIQSGLVPVGQCLLGSGDPFFITFNKTNPSLVQVIHDGIDKNGKLMDQAVIEVSATLSDFFASAEPY